MWQVVIQQIKEDDLMKSIEYLLKAYGMAKESKYMIVWNVGDNINQN